MFEAQLVKVHSIHVPNFRNKKSELTHTRSVLFHGGGLNLQNKTWRYTGNPDDYCQRRNVTQKKQHQIGLQWTDSTQHYECMCCQPSYSKQISSLSFMGTYIIPFFLHTQRCIHTCRQYWADQFHARNSKGPGKIPAIPEMSKFTLRHCSCHWYCCVGIGAMFHKSNVGTAEKIDQVLAAWKFQWMK